MPPFPLQAYAKDEEALKALHETILAITVMLRSDEEEEETKPVVTGETETKTEVASTTPSVEPVLPSPAPLINQFAMRATYVIGDVEDDRLTTSYWLALPAGDESDQELDLVRRYSPATPLSSVSLLIIP